MEIFWIMGEKVSWASLLPKNDLKIEIWAKNENLSQKSKYEPKVQATKLLN